MIIKDHADLSREISLNDINDILNNADHLTVDKGDELSVYDDEFLDEIFSSMAWNG